MRKIEVPNDDLLEYARTLISQGHSVTLKIKGYSMRPFLENQRDYAVLYPVTELKMGDVVLAEVLPARYVLHRIIRIGGTHLTLMGDGNLRGTESCDVKNVLGIAKSFIVKDRQVSVDDKCWRWYSYIWPKLRFFRRLLLAVWRRTRKV